MKRTSIKVNELSWKPLYATVRTCATCNSEFYDRRVNGRIPKYCSNACRQKAYREAKKMERPE